MLPACRQQSAKCSHPSAAGAVAVKQSVCLFQEQHSPYAASVAANYYDRRRQFPVSDCASTKFSSFGLSAECTVLEPRHTVYVSV